MTPAEEAVADYRQSASVLGDLAGVTLVLPMLIPMTSEVFRARRCRADMAVELGLAGIVATNTTISREGLKTIILTAHMAHNPRPSRA